MKFFGKMLTIAGVAALMSGVDAAAQDKDFKYLVDEFADLKIMRYKVHGWDELTLKQKEYVYHLAEAAKYGRDIIWMQNCRYNLEIRRVLENILENYEGDRTCDDFIAFETYAKRVFFSNGIHHHYAEDKFFPECPQKYFQKLMKAVGEGHKCKALLPIIYDADVFPQRKSTDKTGDIVAESAVNFYEGVTKAEVEKFYADMMDPTDKTPVSYGLNSRVVKGADGVIYEDVYKVGGLYGAALEKICAELEKAAAVAENDLQKSYIADLIAYYRSGDLNLWDEYNIKWVKDTDAVVDFVNGFVEDYNDPLGRKATWEGLVNFKDAEASRRAELISDNAQWFEDNSPVDSRFKKAQVKGVTAKVINVAVLAGDCYPAAPIGINLPNADWIRREHGSKSVTIANLRRHITWRLRSLLRECFRSLLTHRRKSTQRRSMARSQMTFIQTSMSVLVMDQASCFLKLLQMHSESIAQLLKRLVQTFSAFIILLILSLLNLVSFRIWRHTRLSMQAISATVCSLSSHALLLVRRTLRPTCRTASSSPTGVMRRDLQTM